MMTLREAHAHTLILAALDRHPDALSAPPGGRELVTWLEERGELHAAGAARSLAGLLEAPGAGSEP
jgi:hypothetical protein